MPDNAEFKKLRWPEIVLRFLGAIVAIFFASVAVIIIMHAWEDPMDPTPTQRDADYTAGKLINYLNHEDLYDREYGFSADGRFALADDSPTLDEARYLKSVAEPLQGCRYEKQKASFLNRPKKFDAFGDKFMYRTQGHMYMFSVDADLVCGDKGKVSSAKIEYSVVPPSMGRVTWVAIGRIYSVSYKNS